MRHESSDFCCDWAANFPIFGRKKFTALIIIIVLVIVNEHYRPSTMFCHR